MKRLVTSLAFCLALLAAFTMAPTSAQAGASSDISLGVVGPTSGTHMAASSSITPPAHKFSANSPTKTRTLTGASSKGKSYKHTRVRSSKNKKSLHKKRTPAKKSPHSKKKIGMV